MHHLAHNCLESLELEYGNTIKKFTRRSVSEQSPLGSWLVSQGRRQSLRKLFENVCVNVFVFVFRDGWWVSGPLSKEFTLQQKVVKIVMAFVVECTQIRLLSAFSDTPASKNPSKKLCAHQNTYKAPSKNPSKKYFLLIEIGKEGLLERCRSTRSRMSML